AFFFRQLADAVTATISASSTGDSVPDDATIAAALWDLVWSGYVTNDTVAPLCSLLAGTRSTHRSRPTRPRSRYARTRAAMPARSGPPTVAVRWPLLPGRERDVSGRAHAAAAALRERYGVVTGGAVAAERLPGGFAAAYRVLSAFEDTGRARRGYFVAGLGAAQFGTPGSVDRLRSFARPAGSADSDGALVLADTEIGRSHD